MFVFFTSSITFYTAYLVCLLQLKTWHLHIFFSWHLHIMNHHMISSNILMNICMQVFGVCKSYSYITHLSTYTPTRSRANHRLVELDNIKSETILRDFLQKSAELTASYQCFLWFFHSICLKYCACHEKVRPGHTKCCTSHAKSSWQTQWSDAPKCNPSQEISARIS